MIRHLAAVALAVAAVFALASPAQSADKSAMWAPCASAEAAQAIVDARVDELQETGKSQWIVREINDTNPRAVAVVARPGVVWIDEDLGCAFVRSTVDHEWAHIQQDRRYPGHAQGAYGDHFEPIADCVAFLLGNPDFAPYLTKRGFGCTEYELQSAHSLINTLYVKVA